MYVISKDRMSSACNHKEAGTAEVSYDRFWQWTCVEKFGNLPTDVRNRL